MGNNSFIPVLAGLAVDMPIPALAGLCCGPDQDLLCGLADSSGNDGTQHGVNVLRDFETDHRVCLPRRPDQGLSMKIRGVIDAGILVDPRGIEAGVPHGMDVDSGTASDIQNRGRVDVVGDPPRESFCKRPLF